MRTAVVLTGHMRCWADTLPHIMETIVKPYNADVFVSTWEREGYWTSPEKDPQNDGVVKDSPLVLTHHVAVPFGKNLVDLQIDEYDLFEEGFEKQARKYEAWCEQIRPRNIISQFYKIWHGLALMQDHVIKTGHPYDLVIRMRPDLIINDKLPELTPNNIYTLYHRNHSGMGTGDMFVASAYYEAINIGNLVYRYDEMVSEIGRFCPHMFYEWFLTTPLAKKLLEKNNGVWEELPLNKTIQHTPMGQYVDVQV